MNNWKVGPAGQLYDPKTGAYVGQLDANGVERMVVSSTPSARGVVKVTAGADTLAVSTLPTPAVSVRLKDAAAALGIKMGAAFDETVYAGNAPYSQLLRDECDLWTPENAMKDVRTWTPAGTWDFSGADAFMALANAAGKPVRGHTLMYPDHPPSWQNTGNVTAANWQALVDAHMAQCCPRYPPLVGLDVINELFLKGKKLDQDLQNRAQSLQNDITAYQRNYGSMTIGQAKAVEEDLGKKRQNLELYQRSLEQELMEEQAKVNEEPYKKVTDYLNGYAQDKQLQVVLKYNTSSDLLYGGTTIDITQDVINGLNEQYKQELASPNVKTDTTKTVKK